MLCEERTKLFSVQHPGLGRAQGVAHRAPHVASVHKLQHRKNCQNNPCRTRRQMPTEQDDPANHQHICYRPKEATGAAELEQKITGCKTQKKLMACVDFIRKCQ